MTSWNAVDVISEIIVHGHKTAELTLCRDLLASSRNTDDDTLTPAFVAGFESRAHDVDVSCAVECVVASSIRHIDEPALDVLSLLQILRWVHKVRRAELLTPRFLVRVHIHDDNLVGTSGLRTLNDRQANTPSAKDGNIGALLNALLACCNSCGAIAGGDTAAKQARAVHGRVLRDCYARDVGHNGILGEGGGAHKVQDILALGLEARCSVGHYAFALRGADLTAEVGLARLAEFAFAALGSAIARQPTISLVSPSTSRSLEMAPLTKDRQPNHPSLHS